MSLVTLRTTIGQSAVLVARPAAVDIGGLSLDIAEAFAGARQENRVPLIVASRDLAEHPLLALRPQGLPGPAVSAGGLVRLRAWWVAGMHRRAVESARRSSSRHFEWHKELRRYASDERLPLPLRTSLRESARRAAARAEQLEPAVERLPRRLLREPVAVSLPMELQERARRLAQAAGLRDDRAWVAVEWRRRPDALLPTLEWLAARDYQVVRIGVAHEPLRMRGVVDLAASASRLDLLDLHVVMRARFLICESLGHQQLGYLTNTPSLLLNAEDPFRAYPVRARSAVSLATPVDLDSGRRFEIGEMLQPEYLKAMRNCGHRENDPDHVLLAVREMEVSLHEDWRESSAQRHARELVTRSSERAAEENPRMAQWGPDAGFLGDGRLVDWQAEALQ